MHRLRRSLSRAALLLVAVPWPACAGPATPAAPSEPLPAETAAPTTEVHLAERVVGAADLRAAVADGVTSLTLQRVRFADARPFSGLREHPTLRRVAFVETSVSRASLLDDVLATPNLDELDLGVLPGLGRVGAAVHADAETLVVLAQLAKSEPRATRVRLRAQGRHGRSLEELLHLAARNAAAEDLRGSAGLDLAGPGASTPPRPGGSSLLPEQQRLAAAMQLRTLAPDLRARFDLGR